MKGLVLVLLPGAQGSQPGQETAVGVSLAGQDLIPLHGLFGVAHQFVDVRDLVDHFRHVRDYSLEFLKGLKGFHEHVQLFVHKSQVVQGFDAVSLHSDCFKVLFFRTQEVGTHEVTVTTVYKGFSLILYIIFIYYNVSYW
jgi:hypothetical protein